MNRKVTLLYISLACVLSLQAQTRQQMGGVYYAYPEGPSAKTGTFGTATYVLSDSLNVPQGYAPFYISHYGRHGSRWMPKDDRYVWICKHFEDESNLTPLGLQVKGMLQRVWENARGNGGKLSKLGALQHQGIAHRMFERYPQIFAAGNAVKARSSVVDRCAKSMQAFTSELHSLQPGLNLDVKTDSADMAWIAYVSPEVKALENRTHVQAQVSPRRFLLQLFKDVSKVNEPLKLMTEMHTVASSIQDVGLNFSSYPQDIEDGLNALSPMMSSVPSMKPITFGWLSTMVPWRRMRIFLPVVLSPYGRISRRRLIGLCVLLSHRLHFALVMIQPFTVFCLSSLM